MNQRASTSIVLLTAAIYAGFAVWLGLWPSALLTAFEIRQSTPAMLTEIRAFYGGVEIGIATAMLLLWQRGNVSAALLLGGLPLLGSSLGRGLGMFVDGFSSTHTVFAGLEFLGGAICLGSYLMTRKLH